MRNRTNRILIVTILIAVLLRVGAAVYLGDKVNNLPGTADQVSYHTLAQRVLSGHGFSFGEPWWPATAANAPTAHWSYLYTGYLILVYSLFGPNPLAARLFQAAAVGILQPVLAYLIGRRMYGRTVGLAAAALTAVYAYFIYYAANLMTESFYITAILASFYLAILMVSPHSESPEPAAEESHWSNRVQPGLVDARPSQPGFNLKLAIGLGLALGAAVLLRQLFLLVIPFLFLWILSGGRRQITNLLVSAAVIVAMIVPFTIFNYARFGRFVLLNTNAGFAFFWGNHPIYGTHFIPILPPEMGQYKDLIPAELKSLDEAALDQALLKRGLQFILDDPQRYLLLSISRIPSYVMFWPSSDSELLSNIARVASFGVLWPFMLYGLLLSFTRRLSFRLRPPSPALLLYIFILVYSGIHLLTWTLIRYRLPVDAILLVFAGLALADLAERIFVPRRRLQLPVEPQQAPRKV